MPKPICWLAHAPYVDERNLAVHAELATVLREAVVLRLKVRNAQVLALRVEERCDLALREAIFLLLHVRADSSYDRSRSYSMLTYAPAFLRVGEMSRRDKL